MTIWLDHFAVSARSLAEGTAAVEAALGVPLTPIGQHARMGTHNRLLSLGPEIYLEVIAIDPDAPPPGRPRWFDLDRFSGPPRLTNWICACDGLTAALQNRPGAGVPVDFERGIYRWKMAVPDDGCLPMDGAHPALIEWAGDAHPAAALPDRGCRLVSLRVIHPQAEALGRSLGLTDARIILEPGPAKRLIAEIDTPTGRKILE